MKRIASFGLIFVLCILAQAQVYVKKGNLWDACLEKNVESLLMLFTDGTFLISTCYMENAVVMPWEVAFKAHEPGDLLVIIHNHLGIDRWSEMDDRTNRMFRERGYAGPILLRLGNGKIIKWED